MNMVAEAHFTAEFVLHALQNSEQMRAISLHATAQRTEQRKLWM